MVMDIHLRTILCAIDFSEFASQALHYGVGLSKSFGAHLLVFHSVNITEDQLFASPIAEHEEELQRLARKASKKIEKIMVPYEVNWSPVVTKGNPVDKVEEIVGQAEVDLVIAASHGLSGFKRLLLGTIVERMARELNCPFLIIRPQKRFKPSEDKDHIALKNVVVGCDLTPDISPVLEYARYFAKKFNSNIHLLYTMESPVDENMIDKTEGPYDEVQQTLIHRLRNRLLDLYPDTTAEGFTVKAVLETGIPGEALVRYAKQQAADLMIVGIKRHGTIEKLLVGSTTEAVIRHSTSPVLVVHPNITSLK
jgi:nucleotide-binding universal stress UspA family protein